jgi:hypothetical protein
MKGADCFHLCREPHLVFISPSSFLAALLQAPDSVTIRILRRRPSKRGVQITRPLLPSIPRARLDVATHPLPLLLCRRLSAVVGGGKRQQHEGHCVSSCDQQ